VRALPDLPQRDECVLADSAFFVAADWSHRQLFSPLFVDEIERVLTVSDSRPAALPRGKL
jgi:hypothetical protein